MNFQIISFIQPPTAMKAVKSKTCVCTALKNKLYLSITCICNILSLIYHTNKYNLIVGNSDYNNSNNNKSFGV